MDDEAVEGTGIGLLSRRDFWMTYGSAAILLEVVRVLVVVVLDGVVCLILQLRSG